MTVVNVHEAKTQLSRLLEAVEAGESVTIARAGRPVARLVRIAADDHPRRLGFLAGQGRIPDDFDDLAADEVEAIFQQRDVPAS